MSKSRIRYWLSGMTIFLLLMAATNTTALRGIAVSAADTEAISQPETPSARFPFRSHYVEVEGAKMHYVDEGEGEPILLLHGTPTSAYMWRNVIPHLSVLGRVIAVDLIGFGKSDKPDIAYRFTDHVRYLEGFIEKLRLKNLTLVMHDWGGALGFHYATRHPANIKGLAFFETLLAPLPPLESWPEPYRGLWQRFRTPEEGWDLIVNQNYFIEQRLPAEVKRRLSDEEMNHYREPFRNPASRKPLWRWPNELPIGGVPAEVAKIQEDYLKKLQQSELPKLVLYANPGSLMPESVIEWMKQNFKNLKAVYVGEGLHQLTEDLPMEISAALAEWIHLDLNASKASLSEVTVPPPGKLYDLGGYKLHLHCTGRSQGPTVVLDAGAPGWSIYWDAIQKEVSKFARVCTYDRAGYGWSEPGPGPRTAKQSADELHQLLAKAGENRPLILVGHSFGGYVVRHFADSYRRQVAGVVLVDAAHEAQWERLPGVKQMLESSFAGRRATIAKAHAGQLKKEDFTDSPSPSVLAAYQFAWLQPQTHETALAEQQSAFDSAKQVATTRPLGDLPLVVLTAGNSFAWFIPPTEANLPMIQRLNAIWMEMQVDLTKLSTRSQHIVSANSTHGLTREEPHLVVQAIRQALAAVRSRR